MKTYPIRNIFTLLTLILLSTGVFAQIPDDIILSLKSGNARTLSNYFNENIELVVPDSDDVFSKSQAQQLVARFFKENEPETFTIIHDGGKDGSFYAIGNLSTSTGNFRVYFLLKTNNNKAFIHQLRIEKKG